MKLWVAIEREISCRRSSGGPLSMTVLSMRGIMTTNFALSARASSHPETSGMFQSWCRKQDEKYHRRSPWEVRAFRKQKTSARAVRGADCQWSAQHFRMSSTAKRRCQVAACDRSFDLLDAVTNRGVIVQARQHAAFQHRPHLLDLLEATAGGEVAGFLHEAAMLKNLLPQIRDAGTGHRRMGFER